MALRALLQYLIAVVEVNICILIKPSDLAQSIQNLPEPEEDVVSRDIPATPTGFIRLGSYEPVPYVKFTCFRIGHRRILNYGEQRELGCDDVNWPKVGHRRVQNGAGLCGRRVLEARHAARVDRIGRGGTGAKRSHCCSVSRLFDWWSSGRRAIRLEGNEPAANRCRGLSEPPDLYCLELARSTLVQGIPFAVLEPCQFERPRSPPQKSARAKVMH